jgi:hypothetical protein
MTGEELLRGALVTLEAGGGFSEAVLLLRDGSRLCFCHRVGERWAKAVGPDGAEAEAGVAGEVLSRMAMVRLNAKHLDIQFADGSRWEWRFRKPAEGR